ncbi:DUF3299 domain-containing protein [Falsiruegeria mediterranea]|uniref:Lipoprotein n=1 Tax=Falsiruegeria mediterranea M17 TaxID=1200281 RepID=A0A2R8C8N8_9RHOB|nr:DUF3299 domain-containing protein [Falsiruegeria mediterranea]SPJ28800.1 hypothetical protein TRM7615_02308 [Falsiruegeria mediterranea M17]
MLNRRSFVSILAAATALPRTVLAEPPREIMWDDLIPPGIPYSEIIGEGELDEINDTWAPIYDANSTKLNEALNGVYIKMPGYILPFDIGADGVTNFLLVPYVGACIHTPPPPANQLVVVNSEKPWPLDRLWEPVWVTGTLRTQLTSTDLGQTGYSISADEMEVYIW